MNAILGFTDRQRHNLRSRNTKNPTIATAQPEARCDQ